MEQPSAMQVGGQHYKNMPIQPAEFCQKNELNFCESAVVKYVCRHESKGGDEDIKKAIHFLHLLREWTYGETAHISSAMSDMDMYQLAAAETAIYPTLGHPIVYPALGLAGEAGEVAEKVKKMCRDDDCILTETSKNALALELSDVLWYVAALATELGYDLSTIARMNIEKLHSRKQRDKINGSGDNR